MHLDSQQPVEATFFHVIIDHLAHRVTVEDMHQHVAANNQVIQVPILLFHPRLQLVGIPQ